MPSLALPERRFDQRVASLFSLRSQLALQTQSSVRQARHTLVRAIWDAEDIRLSTTIDSSMESSSSSSPTDVLDPSSLELRALARYIEALVVEMRETTNSYASKVALLLGKASVRAFLRSGVSGKEVAAVVQGYMGSSEESQHRKAYCILCLLEIGQRHVLSALAEDRLVNGAYRAALDRLSASLEGVEEFYDSIGGIAGYQVTALSIMLEGAGSIDEADGPACHEGGGKASKIDMLVPEGVDIRSDDARASVVAGIKAMGQMAEIYPLGGAGDRLGLQCEETGDSLPTAVLPYCGRSLLEHLIRDVQGREYLHYRLFGCREGLTECDVKKNRRTPIAVMTSMAKGNHNRVMQLFQANDWFGRGPESFKLFQQPMVPMIKADDGRWAMSGPCEVIMKPGGHGVIWKLMLDNGVFNWLKEKDAQSAIVRQISNPMAGQDSTLLALGGAGVAGNKAFGFASCERVVGAAEGMNVVLRETDADGRTTCRISNVEYTEFTKYGIEDKAVNGSSYSLFPANTNVLYLGLDHVEGKVWDSVRNGTTDAILPGMILNLNKSISHVNLETGVVECAPAGRLECTMQNLADCFKAEVDPKEGIHGVDARSLETFLVYGPRSKVTSSAKRKRAPGSLKIHQTPDGSFYDLQQNAKEMLEGCGMEMPDVGSVESYLERGPGFVFLFHPALGPLWDVVAQKISGGRMHPGAEMQLEISEASLTNLDVDGSLLVTADAVMGSLGDGIDSTGGDNALLEYSSDTCARISLTNVSIKNEGIDFENPHNVFWRHRVMRREACRIVLLGRSEFDAADVVLSGDKKFVVPDGHRMIIRAAAEDDPSRLQISVEPLDVEPSWAYEYTLVGEQVVLTKQTSG